MKHTFQKGDRVLSSESNKRGTFSHFKGEKAHFYDDEGIDKFAEIDGDLNGERFVSNLVKIASPEEGDVVFRNCYVHTDEPLKTVTIEHDQWGRVEGAVADSHLKRWTHNGAYYFGCDGWREVKPTKWVSVSVVIKDDGKTLAFEMNKRPVEYYLGANHRWKTAEIEQEVSF